MSISRYKTQLWFQIIVLIKVQVVSLFRMNTIIFKWFLSYY